MKTLRIARWACAAGACAALAHILTGLGDHLTPGLALSTVALIAGCVGAGLAWGYTARQGHTK